MEPTNATSRKHAQLDGKSRRTYCTDKCDQAVVLRAIAKAQRGESAWAIQVRKEGAALGERAIAEAVLHYRMEGVDHTLDEERDMSDRTRAYVARTQDGRPRRAERVWVEATIEGSGGGFEKIDIETDLALLDPDECWPNEFGVALSAGRMTRAKPTRQR